MMMMRPNYAKRVCELCIEIKGVEAFSKRPRKCYRVESELLSFSLYIYASQG